MINLPDKIKDLPAEKLNDVVNNPKEYGLTMSELFQVLDSINYVLEVVSKTQKSDAEKETLKAAINDLQTENRALRTQRDIFKEMLLKFGISEGVDYDD